MTKFGLLGVEKKLCQQARAAAELELDLDFFCFDFKRRLHDSSIRFYARDHGFFPVLQGALDRYGCISEHIDPDKYDILVLRYSKADLFCFSPFFKRIAEKTVTEHHTKELPEARTYQSMFLQKILTLGMETFLGPRILGRCVGLLAISDEVKNYELRRIGSPLPARTVTNGVYVDDVPFTRHARYDGKKLNLLCIATTFDAWHGLDRILAGLDEYGSRRPFVHLKVVGSVREQDRRLAGRLAGSRAAKIDFLGRLYGHELEEIFKTVHAAFSSLALFRNGMHEGCALKTREYLARGLPFIIGHDDPDLREPQPFFLRISPDDSPVDMDEVVAFAERTLRCEEIPERMRRFAADNVDWKIKVQQMWDFLKVVKAAKGLPLERR